MTSITVCNIIRSIPYLCLLSVGVIIFLISLFGYYSYRMIKLSIFHNTFYIPLKYDARDIDELKQWINENINGYACIEPDIYHEGGWITLHYSQNNEILRGWRVRFIRKTDAMAFKLVWITKDGRFDRL